MESKKTNPTSKHVGSSDYSKHEIQPYDIWLEYQLNPWDADIVKRVLRTKKVEGQSSDDTRIEDYRKIIHICESRIQHIQDGDVYYREKE